MVWEMPLGRLTTPFPAEVALTTRLSETTESGPVVDKVAKSFNKTLTKRKIYTQTKISAKKI